MRVMDAPAASENSWEDTFVAVAPRLMRIATLLVGPHDAQDVVAAAVGSVIATKRWESIQAPGSYLTRSVYHAACSHLRKRNRRRARETAAAALSATAKTDSHDADTAQRETVRAALRDLSPRQRSVVYLHYWEDLTLDATAAELGISKGSVHRHLDRAKQVLRTALKGETYP